MADIQNNTNNNRDVNRPQQSQLERLGTTAPGVNIQPVGLVYNIKSSMVESFVSSYLMSGDVKVEGIRDISSFIDESMQQKPRMIILIDKNYYPQKTKNSDVQIAPKLEKKLGGSIPNTKLNLPLDVKEKITSISILWQDKKTGKYNPKSMSTRNKDLIGVELDIFKVLRHMLNVRGNETEIAIPGTYLIGNEIIYNVFKSRKFATNYKLKNNNGNINYKKIAEECIRG